MTDREQNPVRKAAKKADGQAAVLAKMAAMPAPYGANLSAIVRTAAR